MPSPHLYEPLPPPPRYDDPPQEVVEDSETPRHSYVVTLILLGALMACSALAYSYLERHQ